MTGLVTVGGGTMNGASTNIIFQGGITQTSGTVSITGTATFDTNSQALAGTQSIATVSVASGKVLTNNGTITISTALSGSGTWTQGSSSSVLIGGTSGITALTATASGNTVTYNSTAGSQTIVGTTYENLTIDKTGQTGTLGADTTIQSTGVLTITAGTLQLSTFSLTDNGTASITGTLNDNSATGTNIFVGAVTINSGGIWTETNNPAFTFRGGLTNDSSSGFTSGTGVYTFDTNAQTISGSQSFTITNITNNVTTGNGLTFSGAQPTVTTLTQGSNAVLTFSGSLPTITTLTASASGNTVQYTGSSQAITALSYVNLTVNGSGTATIGGTTSASGTMTVSSAVTNNSTLTVTTALSGASTLTQGASSTLNIAGTSGITGLDASTNTNTVAYTGGTQTIKAVTYSGLTVSASGVKSLAGALTVNGTLSITAGSIDTTSGNSYAMTLSVLSIGASGTLTANASAISVSGNWTNAGAFTAGTSTVTLSLTNATTTVTGTTTWNNLTITNAAAREVDFATASTPIYHVTGLFTVTGHSSARIKLYSDSAGTKWQFHPTGTYSLDYVDVKDGGCQSGAVTMILTNSKSSGNNESCWSVTPILTFSNDQASLGFGTLTTANARYATSDGLGSNSDSIAHTFTIATNAPGGYVLSYIGALPTSGTDTIAACTITNSASGSAGTAQFGISVAPPTTGTVASGYDHSSGSGDWKYVANTTTTLVSSSGAAESDSVAVHYLSNISSVTAAGSYSTSITYILTGTY